MSPSADSALGSVPKTFWSNIGRTPQTGSLYDLVMLSIKLVSLLIEGWTGKTKT